MTPKRKGSIRRDIPKETCTVPVSHQNGRATKERPVKLFQQPPQNCQWSVSPQQSPRSCHDGFTKVASPNNNHQGAASVVYSNNNTSFNECLSPGWCQRRRHLEEWRLATACLTVQLWPAAIVPPRGSVSASPTLPLRREISNYGARSVSSTTLCHWRSCYKRMRSLYV